MAKPKWWQEAVFYQIYPRSFADSNGDGIGDLPGIVQRLDYLSDLGIDAIWLSPHYPSPLFDWGYDVSDYTSVAPEYGTMADLQALLDGAHQRGMRVILDLVLNHTSHQHPWFIESRSSRDNPKRDWYVWRNGRSAPKAPFRGEGPPNNWYSCFGGPAWEYDPGTDQYYYHFFLKQQPDLNWRNPHVKEAMWEVVRFWLDRGVDGFRLDAIGTIFEDPDLTNHTVAGTQAELYRALRKTSNEKKRAALERQQEAFYTYQVAQPETYALMHELRALVDQYPDRMLVGEDEDIRYYGGGDDGLHLLFNFPLMQTSRLSPQWVRTNQKERLGALPPGAWPCNTLGNHDRPRVCSHYGAGENDAALARLSAALVLTLRGTPFLYYGEEIGMTDHLLTNVRQFRDPVSLWVYEMETENLCTPPQQAALQAARMGRDKCRTPLQWSEAANAGFSPTGVQTWLPVNPNYAQGINVAEQLADTGSLLHFYRRLLRVRRANPALRVGDYQPLHRKEADYLSFLRHTAGQTCLVVLSWSPRESVLDFDLEHKKARLLFSSHHRPEQREALAHLPVAPFEIYIAELK